MIVRWVRDRSRQTIWSTEQTPCITVPGGVVDRVTEKQPDGEICPSNLPGSKPHCVTHIVLALNKVVLNTTVCVTDRQTSR